MDILIKGMEMHKSCEECFACHECSYESSDYCNILKAMTTRGERRKDCPLVELLKHGRLIDADRLALAVAKAQDSMLHKEYDPFMLLGDVLRWIALAPTVVEANNGTDN